MFEREKPITNRSEPLLGVANKVDIIVAWKCKKYIYLVKLTEGVSAKPC